MAYVDMFSLKRNAGRVEMTGGRAILLAEKAHREGRLDEARGLIELAYRLFDEAADIISPPATSRAGELYSVE